MDEDERAGDDWSLSWFLEPFAGSRGGLDTTPPSTEALERLLEGPDGRSEDGRGGE